MLRVTGGQLSGTVAVPGDKSISHRAALLAALASGVGEIQGFLDAADTNGLLDALVQLGTTIERPAPTTVRIHGRGNAPFHPPDGSLDLGNSGTALRLLAGVLAGRGTRAVLTGDASLRARPMLRIVEPLRRMGARIDAHGGNAPLTLHGGAALTGADHRIDLASAQVSSCLLLAGLHASGRTRVSLAGPARDHTERLLRAYGITTRGGVRGCDWDRVAARVVRVPGDASSAAFVAAGAALVPGSVVRIPAVGANPHRTGFVRVLERMGAGIEWGGVVEHDGEPVADLVVRGRGLRGIRIGASDVPALIDELPALLVLAAFADGTTTVDGAAELRYKESDRLAAVGAGLAAIGGRVTMHDDGLTIDGGRPAGGTVDARDDHRIAMAFAIAGLRAPVTVRNHARIDTSWPGFVATMRAAGLGIDVDG